MEINLSRVIGYSKDSLQSRALMRAIMLDLYPGKTLEMNVLLDVYESGVPRKIKNDGEITEAQYTQYVQKIENEYGLQESYIVEALNAWIDVCLGKGTSSRINYKQKAETANSTPTGVGLSPAQHVHNRPANSPKIYSGSKNDYELKNISSTTVEISKFLGFDEASTIIPNEIDGKRVVGVGASAFTKCAGIQELIISEGIEYIGSDAFKGCGNLRQVQFPSSLSMIGPRAFSYTGIIAVDLPNKIKIIEAYTFECCQNLEAAILPDNLTEIASNAFSRCRALNSIILPASVRRIGYEAFSECDSLADVELNEGLREIGASAFQGCESLKQITIPSTVTKFGDGIFGGKYSFHELGSTLEYLFDEMPHSRDLGITLYCYPKSMAIEYARLNNLKVKSAI